MSSFLIIQELNQNQTRASYRRPSRMSKIFSDLTEALGQKTTESMMAIHKDFEDLGYQENQPIADLETKLYSMIEEILEKVKIINERLNKEERTSNTSTSGGTQRRIISRSWTRTRSSKVSTSEYEESSNRARSKLSQEEVEFEEFYKHEEIYTDVPVFTEPSTNTHTSSPAHDLHLPELAQSSKSSLVERPIGDKDSKFSFFYSPSKTNLTRVHKQELPQENIHKETTQKSFKGIQSQFLDLEGTLETKGVPVSTSNPTYLHVHTFPKQSVLSQLTQAVQVKERPRRNAGTATRRFINSGPIKSTGTKLKRTKQPKNK